MKRIKYSRYLVIFVLASLTARLALILSSSEDKLLEKFLADDAYYYYYYYEIARNISQGKGAVFNEGVVTNGFHPLYALILTPLFKLSDHFPSFSLAHLSLITLTFFHALHL